MLTPYTGANSEILANKRFNEVFSSGRVIIEHVMGLLKSRWSSLRAIRTQIRTKFDFKSISEWIVCCIILHNIANSFNDTILNEWEGDIPDETNLSLTGNVIDLSADSKRERLKTVILERFY